MASNFQLNVKAIVDSANIQEQIKNIKIEPIKVQIDLGGISKSDSGFAGISGGIQDATKATEQLNQATQDLDVTIKKTYAADDLTKPIKQIETFKSGYSAATQTVSELDAATGKLKTVTVTTTDSMGREKDAIVKNQQQIAALKLRIEGLTEEQNKRVNASERIAKIEAMGAGTTKEQAQAIRGLSSEVSAVTKGMNTFHATLEYMTERFVQIGLYVAIFRKLKSAISDMVETVSSLDSSLVELRKVTDLSDSQLESFTKSAFEAGETLARTGREVVDATAVFSRAGYDIQEAFDLGKSALLLVNTADGINDVADASETLISVLKAFNMEATESTHIVDALNEVSNNYAIDTNNLADILQRVSGTLGQTGTTMEEVFGLAVGGYTTLRNAEMVASGLNMISQRMRGMKEDGEEIEGLVPKIESALQEYTNGAVTMWDKQTGELRSTYDVLNDLAKVYPSLSSAQKAYLNEVIAGDDTTLYVQKCA